MHFITEIDLRACYRQTQFTTYTIEEGTRLTPEARQFLLDRKISFSNQNKQAEVTKLRKKQSVQGEVAPSENLYNPIESKWERLHALFLLAVSFLVEEDMYTAEQIMILGNYLNILRTGSDNQSSLPDISSFCSEVPAKEHEVSAFHIQLPKGKEIMFLNYLLVSLNELISDIHGIKKQFNETEQQEYHFTEEHLEKIASILKGSIHKAIGGKK